MTKLEARKQILSKIKRPRVRYGRNILIRRVDNPASIFFPFTTESAEEQIERQLKEGRLRNPFPDLISLI